MGKDANPVRVTLDDVAADAGVSPATASLILRHQDEYVGHFRPETIQRVIESARRLGYRSNLFARSLDAKGSSFFAVVLHAPARGQLNDWLTRVNRDELLAGAVEAASRAGVYPIVAMAGLEAGESVVRSIIDLVGGGVFATLVQAPNRALEDAMRDRLMHHDLVAVAFPRRLANWESNAIDVDNARVAEVAAELLSRQGRRRWAVVCDDTGCDGLALRQSAFRHRANEAGIAVRSLELPFGTNHLTIRDLIVDQLRHSHLDACFAPTLMAAVGAVLACRQAGLTPGEDVSIIGCDCARWPTNSLPQVTCVDVSWNHAGKVATRRLLELRQKGEHRFDNILLAPRVVPGDTCPVPEGFSGVEDPAIPRLEGEPDPSLPPQDEGPSRSSRAW